MRKKVVFDVIDIIGLPSVCPEDAWFRRYRRQPQIVVATSLLQP